MVYKHVYLNTLLLLHSSFMLVGEAAAKRGRLEAMHQIDMDFILMIMKNHGKIMEFCF